MTVKTISILYKNSVFNNRYALVILFFLFFCQWIIQIISKHTFSFYSNVNSIIYTRCIFIGHNLYTHYTYLQRKEVKIFLFKKNKYLNKFCRKYIYTNRRVSVWTLFLNNVTYLHICISIFWIFLFTFIEQIYAIYICHKSLMQNIVWTYASISLKMFEDADIFIKCAVYIYIIKIMQKLRSFRWKKIKYWIRT